MTKTDEISGKTFKISFSEGLVAQADWLLNLLRRTEEVRGIGFLKENVRLQVGWSILTIVRRGQEYVVCEPDFANNPFDATREDTTCSLSVQAEQNDLLNRLGIEGMPVSFQDKVVLSKDCLRQRSVYLERKTSANGDSGWYIGPKDSDAASDEYEAVFVYQLLTLRPALLKALALPTGYLAVFEGNEIEAVLNDHDEQVWPLDVG